MSVRLHPHALVEEILSGRFGGPGEDGAHHADARAQVQRFHDVTGILDTAIGDDRNIVRLAAISGPVELAVGANKVQLLHASKKGFWWKI